MSGDAYHMTSPAPGGAGAIHAMEMALRDAGLQPEAIDYINAHGTSTQYNDKAESEAIRSVFGDRDSLHVSSTKSSTGHLLGAAAGIEFVVSVKAIQEQTMPPTANLKDVDPECPVNVIHGQAVRIGQPTALMLNHTWFGQAVAMLLAAPK